MTTVNLCRRVVGRSIAAVVLGSATAALAGASAQNDATKQEWIQLFNGRNLDGWTPKFAKHDLGENFNDTVRVEGGLLEVRYDKWQGFNGEFGHIFYRDSFSYYRLVAEYRFVGQQVAGGPPWAVRNNGLMLHCQKPSTTSARTSTTPSASKTGSSKSATTSGPSSTASSAICSTRTPSPITASPPNIDSSASR